MDCRHAADGPLSRLIVRIISGSLTRGRRFQTASVPHFPCVGGDRHTYCSYTLHDEIVIEAGNAIEDQV